MLPYTPAVDTATLAQSSMQLGELPRFDPTLGTLTGVRLGFGSQLSIWVSGEAWDKQAESDFSPLPPFIVNDRNDTGFSAPWSVTLRLALFDPAGASACLRSAQLAGLGLAAVPLHAVVGSDPINFFARMDKRLNASCDGDDGGDVCRLGAFT